MTNNTFITYEYNEYADFNKIFKDFSKKMTVSKKKKLKIIRISPRSKKITSILIPKSLIVEIEFPPQKGDTGSGFREMRELFLNITSRSEDNFLESYYYLPESGEYSEIVIPQEKAIGESPGECLVNLLQRLIEEGIV